MVFILEPKDLVRTFLSEELEERNYFWIYNENDERLKNKGGKFLSNRPSTKFGVLEFEAILETVKTCSRDFSNFIKSNMIRREHFDSMVYEMIGNFKYRTFKVLADELFRKNIGWDLIISLMVFGLECALRLVDRLWNEDMISDLSDWITNYIVKYLEPWIFQQDDDWFSITSQVHASKMDEPNRQVGPRFSGKTKLICLAITIFVVGFELKALGLLND